MLSLITKADCKSRYSWEVLFSFRSTVNCSKPCSEVEWLVSRHFWNILQQFWLKLLLHKFQCITMHLHQFLLVCIASNARLTALYQSPGGTAKTTGFIQKIATIFEGLFKDRIRFSRTTYQEYNFYRLYKNAHPSIF